jgi:hypothetical protein
VAGIDSDFCILAEEFRRFIFVDLSWDTTTRPMLRLPIPVYCISMKAFFSSPLSGHRVSPVALNCMPPWDMLTFINHDAQ